MRMPTRHVLPFLTRSLLLAATALLGMLSPTQALGEEQTRCTCAGGGTIEIGAVRYGGNSDRETITKIKVGNEYSERYCGAIWISRTEIRPTGTPYRFHLTRKQWKEQREDGCGDLAAPFLKRAKTYHFVLDADSQSIREIEPEMTEVATEPLIGNASSQSNTNVWNAISLEHPVEVAKKANRSARNVSSPEFARSAWVFARKEITGRYVGLVHGPDQEGVVALPKTHKIKAGQLGQIEAFRGRTALVRFYSGSRIEKFAKTKNALRRWYDNAGGPYTESKDDLYTPLRACILEVSLDDLIEINDYLDQQNTDRT